jgi:rod shape-determining protein MreC
MGGFLPPAERRSSALLGLYAALSLVLLMTGERIPQSWLRAGGAFVFAPFDRVVLTADRVAAAWRDNQQLQQHLAELEVENERLRVAGVENQRLRQQLALPTLHGYALKPVEVLALSGEAVPAAATLSAGTHQGVREGDAVVTAEGLLGRIGESYSGMSRVVLLTDLNSAVACEVESTGVLGVLRFSMAPRPRLVLTGVPLADTVRVGQQVITSGLSRRYPRGLPVGRVVRLAKDPSGLVQDIEVDAAARLSRVRQAFVIARPPALEDHP